MAECAKMDQGVSPCSHSDLIPLGLDTIWDPTTIHRGQKYSQPTAGAAGGREREVRTVNREHEARTVIPHVGGGINVLGALRVHSTIWVCSVSAPNRGHGILLPKRGTKPNIDQNGQPTSSHHGVVEAETRNNEQRERNIHRMRPTNVTPKLT